MVGEKSGTITNIATTMGIKVDNMVDDDNATFIKLPSHREKTVLILHEIMKCEPY